MKVAPQNVTFLCGQSVPYMALGMQDIRKLGLLPNLAFFDIYYGTLGEIPVSIFRQQPLFSNVPSWLTNVKYRVLEKLHNSEDTGHGGEQRMYALAHKLYPTMEITRSDVREFIRYCMRWLTNCILPWKSLDQMLGNLFDTAITVKSRINATSSMYRMLRLLIQCLT